MPKSAPQRMGEPHGELTKSHFVTVAEAALREWSAVANREQTKLLRSVTFELFDDLPGNALAWSIGDGNILLDMNPAGYGWFVDGTPRESSESQSTNGTLLAGPSSPAHRCMDLLTVMMHEIGHVLGCEHGADELMSATLAAGQRRLEDARSSQTENYMDS